MSEYTICFDFPNQPEPMFPVMLKHGLGWTTSLENAMLFDTEADAQRLLENGYGPGSRPYGVVVEMGQPKAAA